MQKFRTQTLIEIAICAAMALLVDILIPTPGWSFAITVKMVPIILLALRRGTVAGMLGGFVWGILQWITGDAYILTLVQFILEYFVAFALIGLAGLTSHKLQIALSNDPTNYKKHIQLAVAGTIIGSLARYVIHFIAGIWFWGSYAPEGQSPFLYSFLVNGSSFLSETICCIVVLVLLVKTYHHLILIKKKSY